MIAIDRLRCSEHYVLINCYRYRIQTGTVASFLIESMQNNFLRWQSAAPRIHCHALPRWACPHSMSGSLQAYRRMPLPVHGFRFCRWLVMRLLSCAKSELSVPQCLMSLTRIPLQLYQSDMMQVHSISDSDSIVRFWWQLLSNWKRTRAFREEVSEKR